MRLSLLFTILFIYLFQSGISYSQKDSIRVSQDSLYVKDNDPNELPGGKGFLISADSGKSYLLIKASIRLNGAYDINGLQSEQTFDTYQIPVGSANTSDHRFYLSAFQSRFGIEGQKKTGIGNIFIKLEGDFLGKDNNFRMRYAYGVLKSFLLGKARSVFADGDAIPNTVDRDGVNSSLSERTVQMRLQPPQKNQIRWAVSLESPDPNVTTPDSVETDPAFQSFPDLASNIKISSESWGHFQFATIFRSITVRNPDGNLQRLAGYGGLLSGKLKINERPEIMFQFYGGKGIARYVESLKGNGLDAIYDVNDSTYYILPTFGGYISAGFYWGKIFSTSLTAGITRIKNLSSQPGDAFKESFYGSVTFFTKLKNSVAFGFEYSYGKRINKNGDSGDANRISFISVIDF